MRSGALRSREGLVFGGSMSMSESVAGCVVRGLLVEGSHRQGGFCHEAGFVLGQGTKPTLVIGP